MAKKKYKNKKPSQRWKKYRLEGLKLIKSPSCPKCGEGTFLALNKDRAYCGRCHYVEYKK
ncbi:30S ribosomal protein S27ae [Candidatus Woesearchaeota archaeon]|nr:30S ribosomal protein S27ae [Candidatus Woesearchaeota archaeon]